MSKFENFIIQVTKTNYDAKIKYFPIIFARNVWKITLSGKEKERPTIWGYRGMASK